MGISQDDGSQKKTIYTRGAEDGAWMGFYLIVLMGAMIASLNSPLFGIPTLALMAGVPCLTYFFLRRTHVAAHGMTVFSALWMQGIVMFACGSLLLCLAGYVYMRWLDPGFIVEVLQKAAEAYEAVPDANAQEMAEELRTLLASRYVPAPQTLIMGWMWLGMFSGSLLSLVVAAIVRLKRVPLG